MPTKKRKRRLFSIKEELLEKSREAALSAVQIFNNPNITFKSESYIILMVIAWTYLLHAYYRDQKVEYRYYTKINTRRKFDRTKSGAYKYWELERCLNDRKSPVEKDAANNLRFLIGLRHEIEHQMTTRIDDLLSARFQACCLNYNEVIKTLFGDKYGIDKSLSFSLQFSSLSEEQLQTLDSHPELPGHIHKYITDFDGTLSQAEFDSPKFAYRVLFVPKTANRPGQADKLIEFVRSDSEIAKTVNTQYVLTKETEKKKWLPSEIVRRVNAEGFKNFRMHEHTELWKAENAKAAGKGYGVQVSKTWYWYDKWVAYVKKHCQVNAEKYR